MDTKMEKSRVFIASSGRTLLLAEILGDELRTEFCEPRLWSKESRRQPSATIIEMLEGATTQCDFAVIVLAKDDVVTGGKGETLKARDNCVFEAGLFMAAIGRRRCFLVNSVRQEDLPTDLSGIISIPFKEPADLEDRAACEEAVTVVASTLKNVMQKEGLFAYHGRLPLLSVEDLFRRERPLSDGGDLTEDQVVLVDNQPTVEIPRAEQIRRNIDSGVRYHCCFYFSDNTVEKVCQALQMIVWVAMPRVAGSSDWGARVATIKDNRERVLTELQDLCHNRKLRITLLLTEPTSLFRVHNASDPDRARSYLKRVDTERRTVQFVLWAVGQEALRVWHALPRFLEEDRDDRLFIPLKFPPFDDTKKRELDGMLTRSLSRYFPGMELEVKKICLGSTL
jgi:Predicted nucleotide-binding protein containing TIR-like domain